MNYPDKYWWQTVLNRKTDDIEQYHAFLILDLYKLIDDISPYKNIVMRSIKGDIKCYPDYMNDIENTVNRILDKNVEEVEEVESKDNYKCLITKDRNMKYFKYLDVLSERLLKIYNKYKSREDELIDKLINKNNVKGHSYMNDINNILLKIYKLKKDFNAYEKKVKNSQNKARNSASTNSPNNTARLRSPLNRLSASSSYKNWFRKTRRSKKNRSTRKRK